MRCDPSHADRLTPSLRWIPGLGRVFALLMLGATMWASAGCYPTKKVEKDDTKYKYKQPPPGYAGGFCGDDNGMAVCVDMSECRSNMGGVCVDPMAPCNGFYCGGEEAGTCMAGQNNFPSCVCNSGFSNTMYPLVCTRNEGAGTTGMGQIDDSEDDDLAVSPDTGMGGAGWDAVDTGQAYR